MKKLLLISALGLCSIIMPCGCMSTWDWPFIIFVNNSSDTIRVEVIEPGKKYSEAYSHGVIYPNSSDDILGERSRKKIFKDSPLQEVFIYKKTSGEDDNTLLTKRIISYDSIKEKEWILYYPFDHNSNCSIEK